MTKLAFVPLPAEPLETQIRNAMIDAGLVPPRAIVIDGQRHRFDGEGKKGPRNSWYRFYGNGIPAGAFGCWKQNIKQRWRAKGLPAMTIAEEAEYEEWLRETIEAQEAEITKRHAVAAFVVEEIWSKAPPAPLDHPYLVRKQIQPHCLRVTGDGRLIAPLYSVDGELTTLQYIQDKPTDGLPAKQFHGGGLSGGSFVILGGLNTEGPVYVVEGFATGATVFEVTGRSTVVAYGAHHLSEVVGHILTLLDGEPADIVVVADNDKGSVGRRGAEQAVATHGGRYIMPPILGDANDYRAAGRDLAELLTPQGHPDRGWLVKATDFAAQPAPIEWLVDGWLQSKALIMVHGPSGHGKTFVVLDWCLRMASGIGDWRGCAVEHADVVYLAGEGHHGLRGRVAAWMAHNVASPRRMLISESGCDLDRQEGLQKAVNAINAWSIRPSLIVVDTLHRFLGGDENSAKDAKAMMDSCAELMGAFGCSVLLVHHTGNNEEAQGRARGSSAWRGALDIEISVRRPDGETIAIEQKKSKDTEMLAPQHGVLQSVAIPGWLDRKGHPVTSAVVVEADAPEPRNKADKAFEKNRQVFEAAWRSAGSETQPGTGRPYISRSALIAFLESPSGGELAPKSAIQATKWSGTSGIVPVLKEKGFLGEAPNGFVCVDDTHMSAMLMSGRGSRETGRE